MAAGAEVKTPTRVLITSTGMIRLELGEPTYLWLELEHQDAAELAEELLIAALNLRKAMAQPK